MKAAIVIFALALSACASVPPPESCRNAIPLTDEQVGLCKAGGGCLVVPKLVLEREITQALEEVAAETRAQCRGRL